MRTSPELSSPGPASKSELPALYTTQFFLYGRQDQLTVDCSPGAMTNQTSGAADLPIQARLVLPWPAVERLAEGLNHVLRERTKWQQAATRGEAPPLPLEKPRRVSARPLAALPGLES